MKLEGFDRWPKWAQHLVVGIVPVVLTVITKDIQPGLPTNEAAMVGFVVFIIGSLLTPGTPIGLWKPTTSADDFSPLSPTSTTADKIHYAHEALPLPLDRTEVMPIIPRAHPDPPGPPDHRAS